MSSTRPTLRERKKAQTRVALEAAALDLFARQGFEGTTIEEIADACDVSPRTYFRYFAAKEDILFCDSDARLDELLRALEARPVGEAPMRSLEEALLAIAREFAEDRERLVTRSQILAASSTLRSHKFERQRGWEEAVTDALRRRGRDAAASETMLELRLVAGAATACLRAALDTWLAEGGDLVALLTSAFEHVRRGLDRGAGVRPLHPAHVSA